MTNNIRFLDRSKADSTAATVTASSEAGNMVVGNMLNTLPGVPWRSTGAASEVISIDLTQSEPVSVVVLYKNNLSNDATVTIQGSDDAGFSVLIYDSGGLPGAEPEYGWGEAPFGMPGFGGYAEEGKAWSHPFLVAWIPLSTARYWRITMEDSANPDGYIQVGRLMIGSYFSPKYNVNWGYSDGWQDLSTQSRTRGGDLRTEHRPRFRKGTLKFSWLDATDSGRFSQMFFEVGRSKDMLISTFPEDGTSRDYLHTMIVKLTDWSLISHTKTGGQLSFTVEESTGYMA